MDLNTIRRMAGVSEVFAGEKASYTKIAEAKEVSLKNDMNELKGRPGMEKFILVHDALSSDSEAGDMITILDGPSFANVFIGAHSGTNDAKVAAKERWTLYHFNQMKRALADVNARLKQAGIDTVVTEGALMEGFKSSYSVGDKVKTSMGEGEIVSHEKVGEKDEHFMVLIGEEGRKKYDLKKKPYKFDSLQGHVTEDCGMPHGENEEGTAKEIECKICGGMMQKDEYYDHMHSEHPEVVKGAHEDEEAKVEFDNQMIVCPVCKEKVKRSEFDDHASAEHAVSPEDEEAMNYKSSLNKGQHVEYNGQPHIVVVPDADADFVGIAPVGQEDNPEAVNLVRARELMNGEEEEIVMDVRMEGEEMKDDLIKLSKVINSVKTPEQLASAEKYAKMMYKKIKKDSDLPIGKGMSLYDDIEKDLAAKKKEIMKEAEEATVWDKAMDDKDESPENPSREEGKVKVPGNVKSALKKEIKELQAAAEKVKVSDAARAEFYTNCANAMERLHDDLDGTLEGLKKAQVFMTSLMTPIMQRIPDVAHDFITRGGEPTTLKNLFKKVKEKK